jgi:hypothetical protein
MPFTYGEIFHLIKRYCLARYDGTNQGIKIKQLTEELIE